MGKTMCGDLSFYPLVELPLMMSYPSSLMRYRNLNQSSFSFVSTIISTRKSALSLPSRTPVEVTQ